jgi:adenine phosphoribosyltransferase
MTLSLEDLRARIRELSGFPEQGLSYHDLSPLLADPESFRTTVELLAEWARPRKPEIVLGAAERGFILGGALAYALGAGFVAAGRPESLPLAPNPDWELEEGPSSLELPAGAIPRGSRVLVHDDVLATGATAKAKTELVRELGGEVVGVLFVAEIVLLDGRRRLAGLDVHSLITL